MRALLRRLQRPIAIDPDALEWLIVATVFVVLGLFCHLGWIGRGGAA